MSVWCTLRLRGSALAVVVALGAGRDLRAQGVTTAAVGGEVSAEEGEPVDGADITVVNRATGVTMRGTTRRGRYEVANLEVGGPYSVIARAIGFQPSGQDSVNLSLGQRLRLAFRLERAVAELDTVVVVGHPSPVLPTSGGLATVISDSLLRRLPTQNRDLYAFVQLSPHVSTPGGGVFGGGVNFRFNSFVIDGASEQALLGRNPAGNAASGKPISIEAVKEYQVLLSPYEVWQGDFAGALVNAVTQNGTNTLHGSGFGYVRDERLARDVPLLRDAPYDRAQYGFTLGGPIIRDRVHFFVASELQHQATPATGPYLGQSAAGVTPVPVNAADIQRFSDVLRSYGIDPGSAGPVTNENPLVNLFARLDIALPAWNGRLVVRHNYGHAETDAFGRASDGSAFPLSSLGQHQISTTNVTVAQLFTRVGQMSNELTLDRYSGPITTEPAVRAPVVSVAVPRVGPLGTTLLQAGSLETAQHRIDTQRDLEIDDNLTIPLGVSHHLTLGTRAELYRVGRVLVSGAYGSWTFSSLDSLAVGEAATYRVAKDFGGGDASFTGALYGVYVADRWQATDRLALTTGVRVDVPVVHGNPPYAPSVDSVFGLRTDVVPAGGVTLSPRIGFTWDVTADRRNRLRGGIGVFVGRPPLLWWLGPFSNYGEGIRTLSCGIRSTDAGPAPGFNPDYLNPPAACANGQGFRTNRGGPVNVLHPDLSYPRTFRASLAYDRLLPWGVVASVEGLYTWGRSDFLFVNRALSGPVATDRFGRVLYGTIDATGVATPNLVSSRFPQVFELLNQSRDHSYDVAVQLEKRWSNRLEARLAYTYSRVRDVQTPLNPLFVDNWRTGRALSGRQDALDLGISDIDQPHRIVAAATWTAPWRKLETSLSLYYVGGSGTPFTYTAAQNPNTGDLNADGTNGNDPIYVPTTAFDSTEIRFLGTPAEVAAQQQAFQRFIVTTPCLASQRGRIMARNSCRSPWVHTLNVALRQGLPSPRGHAVSVELQVYNFLNLLKGGWGLVKTANSALLQQVGQTGGPVGETQPVFRFDPGFVPYHSDDPASYYQLQVALRYSF